MAWEIAASLERQVWAKESWVEARGKDPFKKYEGEGMDNIIQVRKDLTKSKGQHIDYDFIIDLVGGGLTASDVKAGLASFGAATGMALSSSYGADALGNISGLGTTWGAKTNWSTDAGGYGKVVDRAEPVKILADKVEIGMKRHGTRKDSEWIDQLYCDKYREKGKILLSGWFRDFLKLMKIKHLCGVTTWLWPTAGLAPTTHTTTEMTRHLWGGDAESAAELHEGCFFTVEELDRMRELAETSVPKIKPYITEEGEEVWPVLMSTYQANSLKQDEKWYNSHRYANERGSKNPIFTGALAKYNGLLLFSDPWMPLFSTGGATGTLKYARSILMGLNAGCYAEGTDPEWTEDMYSDIADVGDSIGLFLKSKFGFKKTQVAYDGTNLIDIGVIAMDTFYTTAKGSSHS